MFIKIIITLITLFLLFDEYFKVIEKVKKKKRRKIILVVLSLLAFFSLIDVYLGVKDGNELIEKANNIIIKSDTLISNTNAILSDLNTSIESIKETSENINKIDTLIVGVKDSITNQVVILKSAVEKSKEMLRLEELKFKQNQAKLVIFNKDVSLKERNGDSTLFDLEVKYTNKGNRSAQITNISQLILLYDEKSKSLQNIGDIYLENDITSREVTSLTVYERLSKYGIKLKEIENNTDKLIVLVYCKYLDKISRELINYNQIFVSEIKNESQYFSLLNDEDLKKRINIFLKKKKLTNFIF